MNKEKSGFKRVFNPHKFGMDMARILIGPWLLLGYRPHIHYVSPKAKESMKWKHGGMVTSNHVSFNDPLIVAASFWKRRMFFLVGEFIMDFKVRGTLLRWAGCIKVDRTRPDIESMDIASDHLKTGDLISIFPEGQINRTGVLKPFKMGACFMAHNGNVPLIPIYFEKRKHWWNRYHIMVGEMIFPNEKEDSIPKLRKLNDVLFEKTKELQVAYRGLKHNGTGRTIQKAEANR